MHLGIGTAAHPVEQRVAEGVATVDAATVPAGCGPSGEGLPEAWRCDAGLVPVIDLNADVGEDAGAPVEEAELIGIVSSVSVSGGAHAGSPESIDAAVSAAVAAGTVIGAHPSYPDRAGFGRRAIPVDREVLARSLVQQISAVAIAADKAGGAVRYVKPHGALYHEACTQPAAAQLVADAARACGVGVLLLAAAAPVLADRAALGVDIATEAFADRAYRPDGTLLSRGEEGAVLDDEAVVVRQALSVVLDARASTTDGAWVDVSASSLCLHGDTPGALALARAVRRALEDAGVQVHPFVS